MKKDVENELRIWNDQHKSLNSANSIRQRKQREAERLEQLQAVDKQMDDINDGIKTLGTKDQQKVNGYVKHASALTTAADIQPIEFLNQ